MKLKDKVLKALEDNKGNTISGEELATNLQVSRNSIWKAITNLRNEGYEIKALTNKGYCLLEKNDVISEVGLRSFIDNSFSGDIHTYKTIDSTNKVAKKLALEGVKNYTLVISEEQTAGKGRLGRSFHSPSGTGIYMSIIIKPNLSLNDAVLITTAASVSICRAIKKLTNIETNIKWVNDILLNKKKVCGILTEAVTNFESGTIEHIILGIGINFTKPKDGFPEDISSIATALFNDTTNSVTRNQLASEIVNEVMVMIPNLKSREFINEYKERSIVLGKDIKFIINGTENTGTVIDINNDGALIVNDKNNEQIILNSGEITIRNI